MGVLGKRQWQQLAQAFEKRVERERVYLHRELLY